MRGMGLLLYFFSTWLLSAAAAAAAANPHDSALARLKKLKELLGAVAPPAVMD